MGKKGAEGSSTTIGQPRPPLSKTSSAASPSTSQAKDNMLLFSRPDPLQPRRETGEVERLLKTLYIFPDGTRYHHGTQIKGRTLPTPQRRQV
ncbi:hypothetical protein ElyMa_000558100 [Elysia marginata]|uniref:Uncharacterized protein n=1 Tax=Elysia marginata TaxID=1093978 RepID=A0AAV4G1Q3_9GAST|nr:hypothetical protein ElyMa_000558100 [Elysia marginata]